MGTRFSFTSELTEWSRRANWFFLHLGEEQGQEIRDMPLPRGGFGSVKVRATVGSSSWEGSIFPSTDNPSYSLPIKKSVREAEGLKPGQLVTAEVELLT